VREGAAMAAMQAAEEEEISSIYICTCEYIYIYNVYMYTCI